VITLGHDHRYVHWKFNQDMCSTSPLSLPKWQFCTALAFDPINGNIVTAGSDNSKRSKLTLHNLINSQHIPNTVELSNHPHHIHIDPDNSSLLVLEVLAGVILLLLTNPHPQLARLDDQFQVHDTRLPLYQCVQKFGYQNVTHEKAQFRVRGATLPCLCSLKLLKGRTGSTRAHYFARGDTGIVRLWDRRATQSYQTVSIRWLISTWSCI
jgi:hypothetical protein